MRGYSWNIEWVGERRTHGKGSGHVGSETFEETFDAFVFVRLQQDGEDLVFLSFHLFGVHRRGAGAGGRTLDSRLDAM
jgi:hypothetical protein